jgi:hypothetical protein
MEVGGALATIQDYDGLIQAIRAQKEKLGLSDAMVDHLSGLQQGYTGKLLGPAQVKNLGPVSLGVMLQVLCLRLIVVEDAEALKKIQGRFEQKTAPQARFSNHAQPLGMRSLERIKPAIFSMLGKKSGKVRLIKISPAQRRKFARHAATIRWKRMRSTQNAKWREKQQQKAPPDA